MSSNLIRREWVSACHFHDLSEAEVLREVARRVIDVKKKSPPLVLLDLDSTLYEVGPRTYQILREWCESGASEPFRSLRNRLLEELHERHVGYSIRDTFIALGLDLDAPHIQEAVRALKSFWAERFFSSEYLPHDRPYPGAAAFARELHRLGADIVYLTGRDEPNMGEGTRRNLVRDGFPWNTERTHLLLKPAASQQDLTHKKDAAHYLRKHGTLIASFENEPLNLVALYQLFPDAMHVFVDTVCSDHAAIPAQGLYRISSFESSHAVQELREAASELSAK